MVMCFVYDCDHRSDRGADKKCSFVRFPKDPKMLEKWVKAVRREDKTPNKYSRVCGCHFDTNSTVPSIFPWNNDKRFEFKSPQKKIRRKNDRPFLQHTEMNAGCSAIGDGIHFDVEENVGSSFVNDGIFCRGEEDVGCSAVDGGIHCLQDKESERPVAERLDEITSLRLNVEELENENKNLFARIRDIASTQNELEKLKKENENLRLQISSLGAVQKELEKVKKENENLHLQISSFTAVQDELEEVKKKYEDAIQKNFFTTVMQNHELVEHYTGISSKSFNVIHELLADVECEQRVMKIPEIHQLLLTFVKLRHNSTHIDLGIRFGVSKTTVSKILNIYITKLHSVIFKSLMDTVPSRFKNSLSLPKKFETFSNCRMIIDCTEVPCDIPGQMDQQKMTYSSYKSRNTFKVLIGCSPNGTCTFCSELYPGSTSDRAIVENCGILKVFESGDLVLADKGFTITDLLPEGVSLNIPPFLNTPQFSVDEIYETTRTAQARIHIERVINRVKKFRITRHIPTTLFDIANEVVQVCVALVNFQNTIIKSTEQPISSIENPSIEDTDDLIQNLCIEDPDNLTRN